MKNVLQNLHNELFGRVIVIVEQDFIEGRPLDLFFGLGDQAVFKFRISAAHSGPIIITEVKLNLTRCYTRSQRSEMCNGTSRGLLTWRPPNVILSGSAPGELRSL